MNMDKFVFIVLCDDIVCDTTFGFSVSSSVSVFINNKRIGRWYPKLIGTFGLFKISPSEVKYHVRLLLNTIKINVWNNKKKCVQVQGPYWYLNISFCDYFKHWDHFMIILPKKKKKCKSPHLFSYTDLDVDKWLAISSLTHSTSKCSEPIK